MTVGVRHIGIVVENINLVRDFFVEVFGYRVLVDQHESGDFIDNLLGMRGVEVRTIKMTSRGDSLIELLHFQEPKESRTRSMVNPNSTGITHIALTVESIKATLWDLSARGYLPLGNPLKSVNENVAATYVRGPEHLLLEIVEEL